MPAPIFTISEIPHLAPHARLFARLLVADHGSSTRADG
jgi:hypothetical protein